MYHQEHYLEGKYRFFKFSLNAIALRKLHNVLNKCAELICIQ